MMERKQAHLSLYDKEKKTGKEEETSRTSPKEKGPI